MDKGRTLTQHQAITFVIAEREHQDRKWGSLEERSQSLPGFIAVVEAETAEAKAGWIKNVQGNHSALSELVQVAATAIAAIEKYGAEGNG